MAEAGQGNGASPARGEVTAMLGAWQHGEREAAELRFFGGLTLEETAAVTGRSLASVKRDWRAARAFLHRELGLLAGPP